MEIPEKLGIKSPYDPSIPLLGIYPEEIKIEKATSKGGFQNGAGSIRAYPHAENTGLVISDTAKIGSFSITSKLLALFFQITIYFLP